MIVRCAAWLCAPGDYKNTPEYATSACCGAKMIEEICASVPPFLGWSLEKDGKNMTTTYEAGFACGDDGRIGAAKALGGYMCIFPLFISLCSDYTNDSRRNWIVGRLNFISENLGINQASTFAHYQLRLPSMIVKRDALNLASSGWSVSSSLPAALPSIPLPASGTSTALAFAHYTASSIPTNVVQSSTNTYHSVRASYPIDITPPYRIALPGKIPADLDSVQRREMEMLHHSAQIERAKAEAERQHFQQHGRGVPLPALEDGDNGDQDMNAHPRC